MSVSAGVDASVQIIGDVVAADPEAAYVLGLLHPVDEHRAVVRFVAVDRTVGDRDGFEVSAIPYDLVVLVDEMLGLRAASGTVKIYIDKYFIPLTDGRHAQLNENGEYTIKEEAILKSTYFNRIPKNLTQYYFKETFDLKTITYEINKPVIQGKKLNMCPRFMHEYREYSSFSQNVRTKVDFIIKYTFEVITSSNQEMLDYVLNWSARIARGEKNNTALYFKGNQGAGKSTFAIFLSTCLETGSRPLTSNFNTELLGKV